MHVRPRAILGIISQALLAVGLFTAAAVAQQQPESQGTPVPQQSATSAEVSGPGSPADAAQPAPSSSAEAEAKGSEVAKPSPSDPAPQINAPEPPPASRVDLYGGYAYLNPSGNIGGFKYDPSTQGYVVSGAGYLTSHIGLQLEFGQSRYPLEATGPALPLPKIQLGNTNDCFITAQGGAIYRLFAGQHLSPFAHVLGGGAKVGGPKFQPCTWGYGATAGGGLDYILPKFNDHLAIRVVQADYEYMHVDFGPLQKYNLDGGQASLNAVRLSAGLVIRLGEIEPHLEKNLYCDANPEEVYSGEKVTVAANTKNYNTKTLYSYRWELSGGKIEGYGPAVFVDTTGLSAGTYTATAHVSKTAKSKQIAQCSASFIVKSSPPPLIRCSANPTTVNPGDPSTITSYAISIPQRKLTYSYNTSAGQIGGHDTQTRLNTAGVAPGMVTVTCRVQDDLGQTAEASTEITVSAPPLPPAPQVQKLCIVYFNRDARRPARVDNEGRACLDDVALTLEHQPDARLVLIGEHGPDEYEGQLTAAERAVNTRAYLSKEKGIDPSRVDIRTSGEPGRQVETILLAPGAVFDQSTDRVDESKVKIHGQQYAAQEPHARSSKKPIGEGVSHPPR